MDLGSSNFNIHNFDDKGLLEILKRQKQIVEKNNKNLETYIKRHNESTIKDVLKTYLNKDAEYKNDFDFTSSLHKNNTLFHFNKEINEEIFFEVLQIFYWKGYINPISFDELLVRDDEVGKVHYKILRVKSRLKEIYNKNPRLFLNESLKGRIQIDESIYGNYIETNAFRVFITDLQPDEEIECERNYNILLKYGEILELVCSPFGLTSLSSKGFNALNMINIQKSEKHIKEQNSIIKEINKIKGQQTEISNEMKKRIEYFYQNITTILSILVAAFAVIGVNISAIPKIDENFTINVLTINASLVLVLSVMFMFLNSIIGNKKVQAKGTKLTIIGISLIFVIIGILYGAFFEKSEEEKIEEFIKNISNRQILIDKIDYQNLKQELELLNKKVEEIEKISKEN
ncbi:hypothetical protein [Bacillus infantis]|uniref:hypothetical protein n=1 Tax=Bacillus infantis TaxID=324767 RepID=UPI003CEFC805